MIEGIIIGVVSSIIATIILTVIIPRFKELGNKVVGLFGQINKEILSLKKTAQSIYSEAERLKIYGIVISIFIPIWLLIHYFRFLKLQVINNLIIEFETKIHILSPYLSNKEILEFNALWANMNNEQDYIGIVKKIEEKQKEHNAPPLVLASC